MYTTLKTEEEVSLTLPDWTENIYPDEMRPLVERSYALFTETHLMKRIKGGAFLTEIIKKMQNKRKRNLSPDRKIFLYSAHDVTLVNVMNSLGILDQTAKLPEYASALVFELHHSKSFSDGDFEVKVQLDIYNFENVKSNEYFIFAQLVYYFNSDDKFPKELSIPNCDAPCSLTQFRASLEPLLLDNYDESCENPPAECKN